MTPFDARASFAVYPVRRRQPADPRLELRVRRPGGRLPAVRRAPPGRTAARRAAHRPADRAGRPGGRLRPPSLRRGAAPGHRLRLTVSCRAGPAGRDRALVAQPAVREVGFEPGEDPVRPRPRDACRPRRPHRDRALTGARTAAVTVAYGTPCSAAIALRSLPARSAARSSAPVIPSAAAAASAPSRTTPAAGPGPCRSARRASQQRVRHRTAAIRALRRRPGPPSVGRRPRPRRWPRCGRLGGRGRQRGHVDAEGGRERALGTSRSSSDAAVAAAAGCTDRARRRDGQQASAAAPRRGGIVFAATEPMIVPPTIAASTSTPLSAGDPIPGHPGSP